MVFRRVLIVLSLVVCACANQVWAYSGGSGTSQDPYRIATAEDLVLLGNTFDGYDLFYVLTHDIDLSTYTFPQAVIARAIWPAQYVMERDGFSGSFDGQGHVIRNMTIQGSGWLGLFGGLSETGIVCNVSLEDVSILSAGDQTGGLVGFNRGLVLNSSVTGHVQGQALIGGLTGLNQGAIVNCYSGCEVIGLGGIGGLVGTNEYGMIQCAYSLGLVSGSEHAGGLVGRNWGGTITNAYSAASVSGQVSIGGLVGDNPGPGEGYPEGMVANSFWDIQASGQTVSEAGTGLTTPDMESMDTFLAAGWDFIQEPQNGSCDTWSMLDANGYPQLQWFEEPAWHLSGLGSEESPYCISGVSDLGRIMYRPNAHYCLTQSIDLTGMQWSRPLVPYFSGVLDGQRFEVQNLSSTGGIHMGLIGLLASQSVVSNLSVTDANIVDSAGAAGALAAMNKGTTSHCYSTGFVRGVNQVGGLLGVNNGIVQHCFSASEVRGARLVGGLVGDNLQKIQSSYATGQVFVLGEGGGGLAGMNQGAITNCFATGAVKGLNSVGGLVGTQFDGEVSFCYSMGHVEGAQATGGLIGSSSGGSTAESSFWEVDTSIQVRSAGGSGKSTAQMKNAQTFVSAGWDFTGDPRWGIAPVWYVSELQTRPALDGTGQFVVTTQSNAGGAVMVPGEDTYQYLYGTMVPVQALAEPHYHFVNWLGSVADRAWLSDPNAPNTFMHIQGDGDLVANFAIDLHAVTVGHSDHGHIEASSDPSSMYPYGSQMVVSAVPDDKYRFFAWLTQGSVLVEDANEPQTTIHVQGDGSVYAVFGLQIKAQIPDPSLKAAIEEALGIEDVTITEMRTLTRLEVTDANVFDLTGLQHATNLTYLDLTGNNIMDVNAVGSLTKLTVLGLGYNRISDCSALARLTQLEQLALEGNQVSDIAPLQALTKLQAVNFNDNQIRHIDAMALWADLQVLWLNNNAISTISPVVGLEQLSWLAVKGNPLDNVTTQEWIALKQTVESRNVGYILHDPISFVP